MPSTRPRTVLITGAASGIGLATATRFAAAGDTVIATVRSLDRAENLRSAMTDTTATVEVRELDVTTDAVDEVVADILSRHGGIDVLVNNAGLLVEGGLEDIGLASLRRSMEVNFFGIARLTHAVLPSMRTARSGRIIALSSISGTQGMAFNDAYAAAKFAVEGLYESMAPVMAMFSVHLTLVEPGPVSGEFLTKPSAVTGQSSAPYREMFDRFAAVRSRAYASCPSPADIAELIFDVSERADPPLRIQDSEASTAFVAGKLRDLDGSHVMAGTKLFSRPPRDNPGPRQDQTQPTTGCGV